ncbi:MAG TPA: Rossmann-like and DUF2520 domain-containing protein [Egibacteraceae bacterium]|nr:Rossmann-like and DUF2520 domain-containing protein [Egibacteraceae bacterium]
MIRTAVIGPGRVGTALAIALPDVYEVGAVVGRGAAALARFTASVPSAVAQPLAQATRSAQLVLICVPDDQLESVVRSAVRGDGVSEGSRWVHTSGAHGAGALRPARLAGAAVAACHPAQTFPDPQAGAHSLAGASWAVTAAHPDRRWALDLVSDLGGRAEVIPERSRTLYHTALTLGSNGTSSIVTVSRELLLAAGVADPAAFLQPLARTSADNAARAGAAALTGPVRRGDAATVAAHVAELRTVFPEALEAYSALARLALSQARRAGLAADRAAAVDRALEAG